MLILEPKRVQEIAKEIAVSNLSSANVSSIVSSTATDSTGHDAVKITIVITPEAEKRIKGDAALDTLVAIQSRLREEGDSRTAIVEYVTKEELKGKRGSD